MPMSTSRATVFIDDVVSAVGDALSECIVKLNDQDFIPDDKLVRANVELAVVDKPEGVPASFTISSSFEKRKPSPGEMGFSITNTPCKYPRHSDVVAKYGGSDGLDINLNTPPNSVKTGVKTGVKDPSVSLVSTQDADAAATDLMGYRTNSEEFVMPPLDHILVKTEAAKLESVNDKGNQVDSVCLVTPEKGGTVSDPPSPDVVRRPKPPPPTCSSGRLPRQ